MIFETIGITRRLLVALAKSDKNIIINLVENEQVHAQKSTRHLRGTWRLVSSSYFPS